MSVIDEKAALKEYRENRAKRKTELKRMLDDIAAMRERLHELEEDIYCECLNSGDEHFLQTARSFLGSASSRIEHYCEEDES